MNGYFSYDEFLKKVNAYDPSYLTEKSQQGLDIPYFKLGAEDGLADRKSILLVGGFHADPIAVMQLFNIADELNYRYDKIDLDVITLLKTNYIYIVPVINIDAYKYNSDHWDEIVEDETVFRRKNFNLAACSDGNAGVDLSRNWEFKWGGLGETDEGSSADPCHDNYRGSAGASEPEIRGLRDLAASLDVSLYMSYGIGAFFYAMPYSYTGVSDYDGPRAKFYDDTRAALPDDYTLGNIKELVGTVENGVDIDYFENLGAAAL